MFEYHMVVRWPNGDLEGFSGSGFNKATAQMHAESKARCKAAHIFIKWRDVHVLTETEYNALTPHEKREMRSDWDMSARGLA